MVVFDGRRENSVFLSQSVGGVVGIVAVPAELIDEAAPWKIVGVEIWCVLFGKQPGLLPCRGVGVVGDGVSSEGVSERFGFTKLVELWRVYGVGEGKNESEVR